MMILIAAAFVLGFVTGLRSITAIAVFYLSRAVTPLGVIFGIAALGEYVADLAPQTPARTQIGSQILRVIVGGIVGWLVATSIWGVVAGALGALAGTHLGFRARMWATARYGAIAPALVEDAVAIALGTATVIAIR